ncbi:MAG: CDP-glucose 4,6-dehydratase [Lentisphaerae bacterium]|nr:CDP-glucose 4,6-dehydratase [Lentisphaerota bacterium]
MFKSVYKGRKVLVTGHTGFKGSWLCAFLQQLGARVCAMALPPETEPAHYSLLDLEIEEKYIDIRDPAAVKNAIGIFQPEVIFHLAAQPIVRRSYDIPVETFATNCMGTVNILEACRFVPSVRAVVVVTSDKCYENREQEAGYKEEDPMGGFDPYSASKGCAELISASYRRSFFDPETYGESHGVLLATARAGNVIGGGDWAQDRLVPDIMRAAAAGRLAQIRNPRSTRPWQHVLEPLSGYLLLGQELLSGNRQAASAWNFGPDGSGIIDVATAAEKLEKSWDRIKFEINIPEKAPHEAVLLHLDCRKAHEKLQWRGILEPEEMFEFTARWYREFYTRKRVITMEQLEKYMFLAAERGARWAE